MGLLGDIATTEIETSFDLDHDAELVPEAIDLVRHTFTDCETFTALRR